MVPADYRASAARSRTNWFATAPGSATRSFPSATWTRAMRATWCRRSIRKTRNCAPEMAADHRVHPQGLRGAGGSHHAVRAAEASGDGRRATGASGRGRRPAPSFPTPPKPRSSLPETPAPGGTSSNCAAALTPTRRSACWPSRSAASSRKKPRTSSRISSSWTSPTACLPSASFTPKSSEASLQQPVQRGLGDVGVRLAVPFRSGLGRKEGRASPTPTRPLGVRNNPANLSF